MQTAEGVVTIVQESRFHLVDRQGVAHLFTLSHASLAEPQQLPPLQQRQARVRVRYHQAPDTIGFVADRIELLD